MNRLVIFIFVVIFILGFVACSGQTAVSEQLDQIPTETMETTPEPTEEPTATPESTPNPTPEPTPEPPSMLMSFFGEKYNPFYSIAWPKGYSVAEYNIMNGGGGEDRVYNETITYFLILFVDDSVKNVVEYISDLVGDTQNISENIKIIKEGEEGFFPFVDLNGYCDAIESDVEVKIRRNLNNYDIITVMISVCLNEKEGYDIEDYIEIVDLNFDENVIPDWGGEKNLFKEQEPDCSYLNYATSPLEMMSYHNDVDYYVSVTQHYNLKRKDADAYIYMLLHNYGEMVLGGGIEFELEAGQLSVNHIAQNGAFYFILAAEKPDKNICDYNWRLELE